ncbi:MAG: hypothetical protein IJU79_02210 [Desulfovibrionaceae bacterium]|nr:hypothetical protein [Desulfovibrionaceae bacterium]
MTENEDLLWQAIEAKQYVSFLYDGEARIAIPCALGDDGKVAKLRCWQEQGGPTKGKVPGWKLMIVAKIIMLKILPKQFTYIPSGYNPFGDKKIPNIWIKL